MVFFFGEIVTRIFDIHVTLIHTTGCYLISCPKDNEHVSAHTAGHPMPVAARGIHHSSIHQQKPRLLDDYDTRFDLPGLEDVASSAA